MERRDIQFRVEESDKQIDVFISNHVMTEQRLFDSCQDDQQPHLDLEQLFQLPFFECNQSVKLVNFHFDQLPGEKKSFLTSQRLVVRNAGRTVHVIHIKFVRTVVKNVSIFRNGF